MTLPKTALRFVFHFAAEQRYKFMYIFFSCIIWGVNDSIYPYFLKRIINALQNFQGNPSDIFYVVSIPLTLLVLCWTGSEVLFRLQGILWIYTFPRFRADIRREVFNYVKSHSHQYFASNFAGNIAKKLSDLPTSSQNIMEIICFNFTPALAGSIMVLIMMWQTQPVFAIILFTWLCIHLGLTFLFMNRDKYLWENHSDSVSELSGKIIDVLTNILNVRLFSRGKYELSYLKQFQDEEIAKAKKAMWSMEIMRIGLGLNGLFLIFGMVFGLLYSWAHHWITIGDFTQVGMQSFWLLGWIWHVSFQISVFARETSTVSAALSLIRRGHDLVDTADAKPIEIKTGHIKFEDVGFNYDRNRSVFEHFNLDIPAGQKIGLVGFSGSGKTTLVNLIMRFFDIQSGRIMIDDQNVAHVTQDSLRAQIAMIPQDPALFHRTLMENIRYGNLNATDEEVIAAAKLAHCHEFIEKLDDGYQALVGERGIKLSGGQRQRIAIARAILKNAPILILDEATSSLDSVTEKLIQESLAVLMKGKTTIVVAHRLSTLANMDKIIVLNKGKLVETGTKEQLLNAHGHFALLWNMQMNGFLPEEE